jgi:aspartyl-tRNA(Asn)/glutamyl-tRNA(Gln) amidotransferase subunit B
MPYEAVIGVEVHAELETRSKMFCSCPVIDASRAEPNLAVCPICAGLPGVLPVVNQRAVEFALRVALALECEIASTSIFARKNYFYPDLPKGYQISQYETPLAKNGRLAILTTQGEKIIRIRRVHLEEDTGKLTHVAAGQGESSAYSLVDLNRAGIPLLEIVTEPDLRSPEEVRAYAAALRSLLRYLGVNSGDMQKGVLRVEPNVSVRPAGSTSFGTRVEIKNLNSFRALERSVEYEIARQIRDLSEGKVIRQETLGWDVEKEATVLQRSKEGEEDYRYFPEPDLPPLVIDPAWLEKVRQELPELPYARLQRFTTQYGLSDYDAGVLTADKSVADYFEQVVEKTPEVPAKTTANWISSELFALLNEAGESIETVQISPAYLGALLETVEKGQISRSSAKTILIEMFQTGRSPSEIADAHGLRQIASQEEITALVDRALAENPDQLEAYLKGKESLYRWFFGQVMRLAKGKANPQIIQQELNRRLQALKQAQPKSGGQ